MNCDCPLSETTLTEPDEGVSFLDQRGNLDLTCLDSSFFSQGDSQAIANRGWAGCEQLQDGISSTYCYYGVTQTRQHRRKRFHFPDPETKRKFSNARERSRVDSMNSAFDNLRGILPHSSSKLSKVDTLQLAQCYIAALEELLMINN